MTMKKAKIAVLVSGGGTNLQALLDAQAAELLPHGEIALVVSSNEGAYALTRAANAVPELRRRLLNGQVVEFDRCCPSYTAMKDSGVYVYCLVDSGLLPYETFLTDGKRRQAEALRGDELVESGDPLSNFFVSCVPWLAYTQLKHPTTGPDDSNPRFSWGKFTEQNGRITLPVTVFVNHALADGLHIARFYENLDRELSDIVKIIKNSR